MSKSWWPYPQPTAEAFTGEPERLLADKLVPTQTHLVIARLVDYQGDFWKPLQVVRYRGHDYIHDGHHRWFLLQMFGWKTINALVWEPASPVDQGQ